MSVAGALWWLYFDYVDSSIVKRTITAGQIYLYAHLPLLIGLAALGAGVKLAIKATAGERADGRGLVDHRRRYRPVHGRGGRASTSSRRSPARDIDVWLRVGTALLALGLGAVGAEIGIVPVLAVIFAALAAQIVLELAQHDRHHASERRGIEIG